MTEQPADCVKNNCTTPGQHVRCQLCPHSPTYWRLSPDVGQRAVAEQERVERTEP